MKQTFYLLLGTNIGDKMNHLQCAIRHISDCIGPVITTSAVYRTDAWGKTNQDDFFNQVVLTQSTGDPHDVLGQCLAIEKQMGRVRYEKWGERLIDIDLLYVDDKILKTDDLQVPHPEITNRRFTLVPLCEVAPDFKHPQLGKTHTELLQHCVDPLEVSKIL